MSELYYDAQMKLAMKGKWELMAHMSLAVSLLAACSWLLGYDDAMVPMVVFSLVGIVGYLQVLRLKEPTNLTFSTPGKELNNMTDHQKSLLQYHGELSSNTKSNVTKNTSASKIQVSYTSPSDMYNSTEKASGSAIRRRMNMSSYSSPNDVYNSTEKSPGETRRGMTGTSYSSPFSSPLLKTKLNFENDNGQISSNLVPAGKCSSCLNSLETVETNDAAYQLLRDLTVDWISESGSRDVASCVDDWVDNLLKALRKYVREILEAWDKNTGMLVELPGGFFSREKLEQEFKQEAYPSYLEMAYQKALQAYTAEGSRMNMNVQQQNEIKVAISSLNRLVSERKNLEKVFILPNTLSNGNIYSKSVVSEKLKSLFGPTSLSNRWLVSAYPPDADVTVHIACNWLDHKLRVDEKQQDFSTYHLRDSSTPYSSPHTEKALKYRNSPEHGMIASHKWWGLYRSENFHYDVIVQGQLWNVRSGRHNALQAVVLLIYSLKAHRVIGHESIEFIVGGRTSFS